MGIGLKATDVDWSAVSVDFIQRFFLTFGTDLFGLYLFGTGNPLPSGRDYSGNGRDLIKLGAPTSHAGYETMSYALGGYYTPFTENDLLADSAASFTASISGTTMTVTSVASGRLYAGAQVVGAAAGTTIVSQTNGAPGGAGTYVVSASQTLASGALTIGTGMTVLAVVRSASGSQPLIATSSDGSTTSASFVLYQTSTSDVTAQERVDSVHTYAPAIATSTTYRGANFEFVGGAAGNASANAYRRLPGGVGTGKATTAKSPAANPASAQPFGIGRVSPVVGSSGGFTASVDIAALAFIRRLGADAEIDACYAELQTWLAARQSMPI